VAAGVRRIEALTGRAAFAHLRAREALLVEAAELLKANQIETVPRKLQQLLDERRTMEKRVADAMKGGGGGLSDLLANAVEIGGVRVASGELTGVPDMKALQAMGEALREQIGSGVGVVVTRFDDGKAALLAAVSDDVRARGIGADGIVKALAAMTGGRGGGKPHMAQAGLPDAAAMAIALDAVESVISGLAGG